MSKINLIPGETVYTVTINYNLSLDEMIEAGNFHEIHSDLTPGNFPVSGNGQIRRRLQLADISYHNHTMSKVIESIKDLNSYRFGAIEELLALVADQPDLVWGLQIFALGSLWERGQYKLSIPYAIGYEVPERHRNLWVYHYDRFWDTSNRFLIVPGS